MLFSYLNVKRELKIVIKLTVENNVIYYKGRNIDPNLDNLLESCFEEHEAYRGIVLNIKHPQTAGRWP